MTGRGTTSKSSLAAPDSQDETPKLKPAPVPAPPPPPPPSPYDGHEELRLGHLLEQYKLAVEMAHNISAMRQSASNFYISILSAFGLLYSMLEKVPSPAVRDALQYGLPIIAIVLCITWALLIASYRRINAAKYEVITAMEERLPARPYADEWKKLQGGKDTHLPLTKIEAALPALFALVFLVLLILESAAPPAVPKVTGP